MNQTVYFADKKVVFTTQIPAESCHSLLFAQGQTISRDKVLKILETCNSLTVVSSDPAETFRFFAAGFIPVEAAGGVVVNDRGEWLMIHRNGRWDLPKGHLEPGESLAECAVREIAEETGILGAQVVRPLCDTLHIYCMRGCWELKCTHWYHLTISESGGDPSPQTEEGIDCVSWCSEPMIREYLNDSYPTIRRVADCLLVWESV